MELPYRYRSGGARPFTAIAAPGTCKPTPLQAGRGDGAAGTTPGRSAHPAVTRGHTPLPKISCPRQLCQALRISPQAVSCSRTRHSQYHRSALANPCGLSLPAPAVVTRRLRGHLCVVRPGFQRFQPEPFLSAFQEFLNLLNPAFGVVRRNNRATLCLRSELSTTGCIVSEGFGIRTAIKWSGSLKSLDKASLEAELAACKSRGSCKTSKMFRQ